MSQPDDARSGRGAPPAGVLEAVERACDAGERDPAQLGRPLRVVVPSNALREHLAAELLVRAGRARVGVRIETLDALAREVLARGGEAPASELLTPIAVRERARRERALSLDLEGLDDGYAGVVASVDDLLDAGFTAAHAEGLAESLTEFAGGALHARAAALLRVAADVADAIAEGRLGHRSGVLSRADARLRASGSDATAAHGPLPARAIWITGFADATGVQLDLLETLSGSCGAEVWLDAAAPGSSFGARLRERLGATGRVHSAEATPAAAPLAVRYPDPEAEARAAAAWARERLDEGLPAERIALVARDLAPQRLALRRQLRRHGVPFSGVGERGAPGAAARRLGALVDVLERGAALPAERWLDALAPDTTSPDLRDALHVTAIATLGDLAAAEPERWEASTKLVARRGLTVHEGVPVAPARRVDRERLVAASERARATLAALAETPDRASLAQRVAGLRAFARTLGWSPATAGHDELDAAFAEPERAGATAVPREDWPRLLRRVLADAGCDALGGRGGGVQVLSVMEARGCRFDALRVVGLVRGVFPRRLGEDPLLPDALRRALRVVLPDLPVKTEAHEEERFLFAQLLGAAPRVWLSHARTDVAGHASVASPLFERLGVAPGDAVAELPSAPRDAWLHAALRGGRDAFARALPEALAAGRRAAGLPPCDMQALARARLAVLAELDPPHPGHASLGPYLGLVGAARGEADPRRQPPAVTHLEGAARCPWKHFLERHLRLAPPPDVWRALPGAGDARLLGTVVHAALDVLCRPGAGSPWPGDAPAAVVLEAALGVARREGLALPGYAHALARLAAPCVEVARRLDGEEQPTLLAVERDGEATLLAVERDGEATLTGEGAPRTLRFRADRVDEVAGVRRFTDWKTGKPKLEQRTPAARDAAYATRLAHGELLQGHVYALTGGSARYVYLAPEVDDALRTLEVDAGGAQQAAFETSVGTLLDAREQGAYPPRVREPGRDEEPRSCQSCEVKQACVRGDSGVRRRLAAWADATGDDAPALERAALALWRLPEASA